MGRARPARAAALKSTMCHDASRKPPLSDVYGCGPRAVGFDAANNVYVSDAFNNRVLVYHPLDNRAPVAINFKFAPSTLNFGKVKLGKSRSKTLVIGNHSARNGNNVVIVSEATTSRLFTVTNQCRQALLPGGSCKVVVVFTPTDVTPQEAKLVINDDAAGAPQMIDLNGTGE
jgi:hypothetical protein